MNDSMHGLSALFGALMGFGAAMVPVIVQMLNDKYNHARDMEKRDQELDAAKVGYDFQVSSADAAAASAEQWQLNVLDAEEVKGHAVLQFLRSSVRPVLTYGFFLLFAGVKLVGLWHGLYAEHAAVHALLPVVWDEDAESLFAAVVSFWFGSRTVTNAVAQRPRPHLIDNLKGHNNGVPVVGE
jgi:hypothetical protein